MRSFLPDLELRSAVVEDQNGMIGVIARNDDESPAITDDELSMLTAWLGMREQLIAATV